jgi:hypothetical protein
MATPQLSPGVRIREVDLTVGRADNVNPSTGGFAAPFAQGPVEEPVFIEDEARLLQVFGEPSSADNHFEYWMSASSYLAYGGVMRIVRMSGSSLKNANAGVGIASTSSLLIKNLDDYNESYASANNFVYAGKNPGSWLNNVKVCQIDDFADQTIGITTTNLGRLGVQVGLGFSVGISSSLAGSGTVSTFDGYLKGIVVGFTTDSTGASTVDVKVTSRVSTAGTETSFAYAKGNSTTSVLAGQTVKFITAAGTATTEAKTDLTTAITAPGALAGATTILLNSVADVAAGDTLTITGAGTTFAAGVSIVSVGATSVTIGAASTIDAAIVAGTAATVSHISADVPASSVVSVLDWYEQQTLGLDNSTLFWKTLAPRPVTNAYSLNRSGKGDALHVVVVDDDGTITGNQATLLEKHLFLSKAKDAVSSVNSPQRIFYKNYLANNSAYLFAGYNASQAADAFHGTTPTATGFSSGFTALTTGQGLWGQNAQGVTYASLGNVTYTLLGGKNYDGGEDQSASGAFTVDLGDTTAAYNKFLDDSETDIDFLIMGPGLGSKEASQAKANKIITICETRQDCVGVVSPERTDVVNISNSATQTANVIDFFSPISSSSYVVFDSAYKYVYDRFNDVFRYIPGNADIAGLMARTTRDSFPWFSPAGLQRGILLNSIKLAYNPTKAERDLLYQNRINPVINQPGTGVVLFGDKTGLAYASAFDRINVRRLFLYIEDSLKRAADAQLFEFNDEITRANFVNITEPFLRDIQSKRGLIDFRVICDESNNTPDIIDNNEFRADIFLKPSKSINYVELTFVATRTGISFQEVAGRV